MVNFLKTGKKYNVIICCTENHVQAVVLVDEEEPELLERQQEAKELPSRFEDLSSFFSGSSISPLLPPCYLNNAKVYLLCIFTGLTRERSIIHLGIFFPFKSAHAYTADYLILFETSVRVNFLLFTFFYLLYFHAGRILNLLKYFAQN